MLGRDWRVWKHLKNREERGLRLREEQNTRRDKKKEVEKWGGGEGGTCLGSPSK